MLKWFQNNLLGMVLGAMCGLLLMVSLVLVIMSSLPLSVAPADNVADVPSPGLNLPTLASNPPLDTYNVITQRPLFNESRQPVPDEPADNGGSPPEPDPNAKAPEVELAGVVITPSLRMVTLKRKDNAMSLVAFEGRPIEADFGGWQVSHIMPRGATLTSAGGRELKLELKVHDAKIQPPARPVAKKPATAENANAAEVQEAASEPLSRADEIRQRIAERREELKRQAGQSDQPKAAPPRPSYQQAIQSLIQRKSQQKSDQQNEQ